MIVFIWKIPVFQGEISGSQLRDLAYEGWPSSHVNEKNFRRDFTERRDPGKQITFSGHHIRWCLNGNETALQAGLALFAEITCEICFGLHLSRASPRKRDLAINYPISHLGGKGGREILHVNKLRRAGPSITIQPC